MTGEEFPKGEARYSSMLCCRHWLVKATVAVVAFVSLAPFLLIVLYRFVEPPITPLMVLRSFQGYRVRYEWVGFHSIAPVMKRAVIAAEDFGFCSEPTGIDYHAIRYEYEVWRNGGRPLGASTITMQTARNLFLLPGRSWLRKLAELWITPQIALVWPRHRILEVYLNIVEFGPGIHGVEAASRYFFRKDASELTLDQATRLAAVLPSPLHWSASNPGSIVTQRALKIGGRLYYKDYHFDCAE
jgi:monofunctional biosynthetic peptidoglycan transglycosylase